MPTEFPKLSKPDQLYTFTVDVDTKAVKIECEGASTQTLSNECIWMTLYCNALAMSLEEIQSALSYSGHLKKLEDKPDWAPGPPRNISRDKVKELIDTMKGSQADLFVKDLTQEGDQVDMIHGSLTKKLMKLYTLSYDRWRTYSLNMGGGHPALEKQLDDRYWKDLSDKGDRRWSTG
ncbi:MAG: hypothetical protein LQ344_007415 [Seirophora lacunosa]|nr:MAG: hypothetical protein LQ344_007415 [Seirophora lacunosa]